MTAIALASGWSLAAQQRWRNPEALTKDQLERRQNHTTSNTAPKSTSKGPLALLKRCYDRLPPFAKALQPTRYECSYCCKRKRRCAFPPACNIPDGCHKCLLLHSASPTQEPQAQAFGVTRPCTTCLRASLATQLHARHVTAIGCPECDTPWPSRIIYRYLGWSDGRRLSHQLYAEAKRVEEVHWEGFRQTGDVKDVMVGLRVRICPGCKSGFYRVGGCVSVKCEFLRACGVSVWEVG